MAGRRVLKKSNILYVLAQTTKIFSHRLYLFIIFDDLHKVWITNDYCIGL